MSTDGHRERVAAAIRISSQPLVNVPGPGQARAEHGHAGTTRPCGNLYRHATYTIAAYIAGAAR